MSRSNLWLHRGAREVGRDVPATVLTPSPSRRWVPIGHADAVETVERTLLQSGCRIERQRYGLSRDDARPFGTLDLTVEVAPNVTLAVGERLSRPQLKSVTVPPDILTPRHAHFQAAVRR